MMDRLIALADGLRRKPDAPVNAALLLQAAQLAEDELGDLDRALALCRRAEEGKARSLEVWDRLAHIAHKRGDAAECERLIGLIKQCAADADRAEAAAEAHYRAAALELGRPETREAGIRSLCQAVEKGRDVERALELVARVGLPQADLAKILPLYERVARQSGDEQMLLDYLERRCATATVTVAEAREAVDLAVALQRADRIEPLLLRLAEVASERPGAEKEATWALLELVQRRKVAGDLEAAAAALEQVSDRLDPERVLSLSNELSERATRSGNLRLAARLLEKLRARTPDEESVWRPLLQAYVDLQDSEGLDRLVSETLPVLLEPHKRNELRLARARFLLGRDERDAAAVESLRDVLLDEPGNSEAASLLAAHFERTGAEGELVDLLEQRFEHAAQADNRAELRDVALRLGEVLERSDGDRAVALYERALRLMPGQRDLLRRLMARTPAEQVTAGPGPADGRAAGRGRQRPGAAAGEGPGGHLDQAGRRAGRVSGAGKGLGPGTGGGPGRAAGGVVPDPRPLGAAGRSAGERGRTRIRRRGGSGAAAGSGRPAPQPVERRRGGAGPAGTGPPACAQRQGGADRAAAPARPDRRRARRPPGGGGGAAGGVRHRSRRRPSRR